MINDIEKINTLQSSEDNFEVCEESAILDNEGNGNLVENRRIFRTPEGVLIYAGTDRGIGKAENHDRIIINAQMSQFTVVDGMGGDRASQVLAQKIFENPENLETAIELAQSEMKKKNINKGACLISARLTPEKILKISQIGDCGATVFDGTGKIKFNANKQITTRFNHLEVKGMEKIGVERAYQKLVEISSKNFVSSSSAQMHTYNDFQLTEDDIVLLFSDAVLKNFSPEELSYHIANNNDSKDIFDKLSDELRKKMQAASSRFSSKADSIFSNPKERAKCYYDSDYVPQSDNQSLVVFKV